MSRNSNCLIWQYYERPNLEDKIAKCNTCKKKLSYRTTITNLKVHLKQKHFKSYQRFLRSTQEYNLKRARSSSVSNVRIAAEAISKYIDLDTKPFTDNSDSEESTTLEPDNELWGFFDKEPKNRARCTMCGINLKRNTDIMYKHLKEQHSRISENIEFKDNEENYTEVIYLEEPVPETEPKKSKLEKIEEFIPKKPKRRYSYREPLKVNNNNNNQEPIKIINKHDEEIENFGKYITGLLKGVPRQECNKLQMDIVNLIMTSRINNAETSPVVTFSGTIEMRNKNEQTVEESMNMDEDLENRPAKDSEQESITDSKKDPIIQRPKIRPKIFSYKENMASNLTEHDVKEVENFGNYITCLLQSVTNKKIGSKLQMEIIKLIMTARIRDTDNYAPNITINIQNNETATETQILK